MTCFDLFVWPSSGGSIVSIREKTISERCLFFTNIKYSSHIKIFIPKI